MKKIIIEDGLVANHHIEALRTKKNYKYFELEGKRALIIRKRTSLAELEPLLNNIHEVDILFLPNLNSRDIYLGRLVDLLKPQFTIISVNSRSRSSKVKENLRIIGSKSNIIVDSGLLYISKDRFWALKK